MTDVVALNGAERIEPIEECRPRLFSGMEDLLELAVETIDAVLGTGYAEKHPALIGAVLSTNAGHVHTELLAERVLWAGENLGMMARSIDELTSALLQLKESRP